MKENRQPGEGRMSRRLAGYILFWVFIGVISALQAHVSARMEGAPISLWESVGRQIPLWAFWIFVTPLIVWLVRAVPIDRSGWARAVGVHVTAALAATALHALWLVAINHLLDVISQDTWTIWLLFRMIFIGRLYVDILTYGAILGGIVAFDYHDRLRERELRGSRLETRLARARLDALRMQLNPHFMFNALNAIAAQVRGGRGAVAVSMLGGLGELLRYALDSDEDRLVPVWQEIAFLERYFELEQIRFGDRLEVSVEVDPDAEVALVPPLLLQPLAENAVHHGIARRDDGRGAGEEGGPGRIWVRASKEGDGLAISISDNGGGLEAAAPSVAIGDGAAGVASAREGVGLRNTRERLLELYGDQHRFDVGERPGGGVRVELRVPFSATATPAGGGTG